MGNEWAHVQLADYAAITPYVGAGNGYCMTANRISYHLGLRGPSLAVDTACSSSLVAVQLACAALRGGECDRALAGGVNLIVTPALHIFYAQAGLSAPDGRCKPFSADCGGIGRGEGVGVVVLMRLEDAVAQEVPVYAVIRGGAVNHDGRSNGLTAPSRTAQVDVIRRAHAAAGVSPASVRFVEGHGTGTVLGDMIEAKALGEAYGQDRDEALLIGSVKGNIGHAEGAAGIAGLIKTALALHHRVVPPTRSARENPQLRLSRLKLELATSEAPLGSDEVLAGVSSFGLGGTDAHLLLSTAPPAPDGERSVARPGVFTVSGSNLDAIQRNAAASATLVRGCGDSSLTDVCAASNRVKGSLRYRLGIGAIHAQELAAVLEAVASDRALAERLARRPDRVPRIAFAFTGQGSRASRNDARADRELRSLPQAAGRGGPGRRRAPRRLDCRGDDGWRHGDRPDAACAAGDLRRRIRARPDARRSRNRTRRGRWAQRRRAGRGGDRRRPAAGTGRRTCDHPRSVDGPAPGGWGDAQRALRRIGARGVGDRSPLARRRRP